ncbi:pre-mRNA-splicing factor Cwc2p [[Candida] jaroonii]|uniref:Pre-mRNA-splicing factor Cwc2p n=1 Tax=[Candida] jaroonii TaxID=467808 RepID=A0ACA9Y9I1_9ASCO|nr:pre-mRNA-splicing factor Cwc2p [[Candida] jaroonii]
MKPARVQVEQNELPEQQKGLNFNIWYLNSGGSSKTTEKAQFRVNIKKDSGTTKVNSGSICLFFARGYCTKGKNCQYLHRLPQKGDYFPPAKDCFGRDRTNNYRDDMMGVASFAYNSTLYIGGFNLSDNIQTILTKHFGEFGKIEKIKLLKNLNCGFLTYSSEYEAQFAMEAMQGQSLDNNEIVRVRWASEDPNPEAQRENKRKLEERTIEVVRKLLKTDDAGASVESVEPVIEEPEDIEEQEQPQIQPPQSQELQESQEPLGEESKSLFNKDSLKILSQLKKPKSQPSLALGYSSDDE